MGDKQPDTLSNGKERKLLDTLIDRESMAEVETFGDTIGNEEEFVYSLSDTLAKAKDEKYRATKRPRHLSTRWLTR